MAGANWPRAAVLAILTWPACKVLGTRSAVIAVSIKGVWAHNRVHRACGQHEVSMWS